MSYVSQAFVVCDNSSVGNYRSWGSTLSAAIGNMGWIQTADPQINWTTVTVPGAGAFNNEFWKPGDALTSFVLKVGYGNGTSNGPRLQFTLASGSDGSGNLTGLVTAALESTTTGLSPTGSVPQECNFSGDINRLGIMMWRTYTPDICVIERTHNTDGTDNSIGVTILVAGVNPPTTAYQQTLIFGSFLGIPSANKCYIGLGDNVNASSVSGNNVPASPCFPQYGQYGNPMTGVAFVKNADVAEGSIFTTTLYGSTRTYLATSPTVTIPNYCKLCMRYD